MCFIEIVVCFVMQIKVILSNRQDYFWCWYYAKFTPKVHFFVRFLSYGVSGVLYSLQRRGLHAHLSVEAYAFEISK